MSVTRSFSSSSGICWSGAVKRTDPAAIFGLLKRPESPRVQRDSRLLNRDFHAGEMSPMRRRRRDSPRAGTAGQAERSTRYRNLVNPFEPVRILSDRQVEYMHVAALGILDGQGL